jgi:hypothetical protein
VRTLCCPRSLPNEKRRRDILDRGGAFSPFLAIVYLGSNFLPALRLSKVINVFQTIGYVPSVSPRQFGSIENISKYPFSNGESTTEARCAMSAPPFSSPDTNSSFWFAYRNATLGRCAGGMMFNGVFNADSVGTPYCHREGAGPAAGA